MSHKVKYLIRAEVLYIRKGKTISRIAKLLGIAIQTISRWKKEENWDQRRKDFLRSSIAIADTLKDAVSKLVQKLNKEKVDPKEADAIVKMVRAIKALDPDADIISAALIVLDDLLHFLKEKDKQAAEMLDRHIPKFSDYLWDKYGHR